MLSRWQAWPEQAILANASQDRAFGTQVTYMEVDANGSRSFAPHHIEIRDRTGGKIPSDNDRLRFDICSDEYAWDDTRSNGVPIIDPIEPTIEDQAGPFSRSR